MTREPRKPRKPLNSGQFPLTAAVIGARMSRTRTPRETPTAKAMQPMQESTKHWKSNTGTISQSPLLCLTCGEGLIQGASFASLQTHYTVPTHATRCYLRFWRTSHVCPT
jgi:hypothetical protein